MAAECGRFPAFGDCEVEVNSDLGQLTIPTQLIAILLMELLSV